MKVEAGQLRMRERFSSEKAEVTSLGLRFGPGSESNIEVAARSA